MKKMFLVLAVLTAMVIGACAPPAQEQAPAQQEQVPPAQQEEAPPAQQEQAPPAEAGHPLEGDWAWDEGPDYIYTFNADGTGVRGVPGLQETFTWRTTGTDSLYMDLPAMEEAWTFTIANDVLTIDSRQVPGMTFSYMRLQAAAGGAELADHTLVGRWSWDEGPDYIYTFNADGTGTRGVPEMMENFTWTVRGDDHLLMDTGVMEESWTFEISGGVLTIDSRQAPGMTFSYNRMA